MMTEAETVEVQLLIAAMRECYGYDFSGYAESSFRRRLKAILIKKNIPNLSRLQEELLHNSSLFAEVLSDLTVTTSEMFRDPSFFQAFREHIVPVLRTYPTFKIWHAGSGRGEEIYSLAILLEEEGLYDRAVIYATDINHRALQIANEGIYPVQEVKKYTENYLASGGQESFSRYYTVSYGSARFDPSLKRNVLFASHNLVTDDVFSETHVVLCRNVFIYFNRSLQTRVLDLFTRSLRYKGYLCLGSKETVRFIPGGEIYEEIPQGEKIFRKMLRSNPYSVFIS